MDIKDVCNAGGEILDQVASAVERGDFSGLSENVSDTVNRLANQVKRERQRYGTPTHQYGKTEYTRAGQRDYQKKEWQDDYAAYYQKKTEGGGKYDTLYQNPPRSTVRYTGSVRTQSDSAPAFGNLGRKLPSTVTRTPAGRILGPIQLAWGVLGTTGFGITAVVMLILLLANGGTVFSVLLAVFGILTACTVSDIVRGGAKMGLVKRFYEYARLIGDRGYIAIEELAEQTGRKKDAIVRDLKKMMQKRMFLHGRLDSAETTFMLTDEVYEQYKNVERERRQQEAIQQETDREARERNQKIQESHDFDAETKKILTEGSDYIRMVRECNDKIPDEQMSEKLSRLEQIMQRIFEQVEKHPESAGDLHKFMTYYLPTTKKLLNAYIDLDRQEVKGENITNTKREIEETLDTINSAFEQLLDGLFEDTAWDISSDISVMKTMMAQEGLTGKDFTTSK